MCHGFASHHRTNCGRPFVRGCMWPRYARCKRTHCAGWPFRFGCMSQRVLVPPSLTPSPQCPLRYGLYTYGLYSIVMACIVMAYTVMPCIVMAYTVMAYIVVACIACTAMARIVLACIVLACIELACLFMACAAMAYIVMAYIWSAVPSPPSRVVSAASRFACPGTKCWQRV